MKTIPCLVLAILSLALASTNCWSDATLEYLVKTHQAQSNKTQSILIKSDSILIKAAGGNSQLDLLYQRSPEKLRVIDHKKRAVMTIDEQQISTMAKTSEVAQPLLQGFSKQLAQMDPQQRAKWQQMLGTSVSLDKIGEAAKTPKTAKLVETGNSTTINGINCKKFQIMADNVTDTEVCLAGLNSLNLSENDYATLVALLNFFSKIVASTHGLINQLNIPNLSLADLAGIPIEIRNLTKNDNGEIILERIDNTTLADGLMLAPQDYTPQSFAFFK